jgi:hypothetical protein
LEECPASFLRGFEESISRPSGYLRAVWLFFNIDYYFREWDNQTSYERPFETAFNCDVGRASDEVANTTYG